MALTPLQQRQIKKQLRQHRHPDYRVDIRLTDGFALKGFRVNAKVLRPEKMSAIFLARWLLFNNGLYKGKDVIDMGCGSGVQGITAALYGARKVICSDISAAAVENTRSNIAHYRVNAQVRKGDLFENIGEKADMIIFNHPFFSDDSMEQTIVRQAVTDQGVLIHRFLQGAKAHLNEGGFIVMPYYHLAGPANDPQVQAAKNGYSMQEVTRLSLRTTLQKGDFSITLLRPKK